jgi:hypothetical protein
VVFDGVPGCSVPNLFPELFPKLLAGDRTRDESFVVYLPPFCEARRRRKQGVAVDEPHFGPYPKWDNKTELRFGDGRVCDGVVLYAVLR